MKAQSLKLKVDGHKAIPKVVEFLNNWNFDKSACQIEVQAIGATLVYKAVFWIWMRHLAKSFTERGDKEYSADDMHDLMCHQFLGYTEKRVLGRTEIEPALRTITYPKDLSRGDFYHFMRQIEDWAQGVGVPMPEGPSQYSEDKERENQ